MSDLINGLLTLLLPIIEKLEKGERVTLGEYAKLLIAAWQLINEYTERKPVIGRAFGGVEAFAHSADEAVESFAGEDQLADAVDRLSAVVGGERAVWRPDGHLLKQILPVLIKLLPLILAL